MVLSNWRGAICRGTLVLLLAWAGLAWTQTTTQRPSDGTERFVYVHENGQKTRCRVLESWQLPDGRMAHLLESVESKEKITIVDEPAPAGEQGLRGWARQKRIFSWGQGRSTPPDGAPLPPHMRLESGIVINSEAPPPPDAVPSSALILNQGDAQKTRPDNLSTPTPTAVNPEPTPAPSTGMKIVNEAEPAKKPLQIIDFQNPPATTAPAPSGWVPAGSQTASASAGMNPMIVNQTPATTPTPSSDPSRPPLFPRINAFLAKPFSDQNCNSTQPDMKNPSKLASAQGMMPSPQGPQAVPTPILPPAVMPTTSNGAVSTPITINQQTPTPSSLPTTPIAIAQQTPTPSSLPTTPITINQQTPTPSSLPTTPIAIAQQTPAPSSVPTYVCPTPTPNGISSPPNCACPTPANVAPPQAAISPPLAIMTPMPSAITPTPAAVAPTPTPIVAPTPSAIAPPAPEMPIRQSDQAIAPPAAAPTAPVATIPPSTDPIKPPASASADASVKKGWRPGDLLFGWMHKPANPAAPTTPPAQAPTASASTPAVATAPAVATTPTAPTTPTPIAPEPVFVRPPEPRPLFNHEDVLATENKTAEKKINDRVASLPKAPVSTAVAQSPSVPPNPPEMKTPEASPLAIPGSKPAPEEKVAALPPPGPKEEVKPVVGPTLAERDMWGKGTTDNLLPPGRALLDPAAIKPDVVKLPPAPQPRANDPLTTPERFNPTDDKMKPKGIAALPAASKSGAEGEIPPPPRMLPAPPMTAAPSGMSPAPPAYPNGQPNGWPLGTQSVAAARSGLQGPVTYVPVPTVTVPQPNHPPMPPPPQMPNAPQLNAYVNAFTPPPAPQGPAPTPSSVPAWMQPNPALQQQAMMQQQMMQQQQMMAQGYRPNPMNPYFPYNQAPMPSQGPMTNYARNYQGPMPPSPYGMTPAMAGGYAPAPYAPPMAPNYAANYAPPMTPSYAPQPAAQPMMPGYAPQPAAAQPMMPSYAMMPQPPMVQPVSYQQAPTQQVAVMQQVEQMIKVMRESPYPAQRQWAAQSLTSFDWRVHPQIVPALLQSASQDPAAGVRADCVACLGRMQASVEPVFGTLHAMRNDIDPRVRQAVEQAFVNLGQAPMAPQQ